MKPRVLSLFSGIGAFERALKNIGVDYELTGYCEIDPYAARAYSVIHHVPESLNLGDITKIDETALPADIDLLTYGFPCQDISIAGHRKGLVDEDGTKTRSGLLFDALRIIGAVKPKIALAENVKNLTSRSMKPAFDTALNGLESLGYNNYWKILNASDYGMPQNRERVFIVSIRKDADTGTFHFPSPVPLRKRLIDYLEKDPPESCYLSEDKTKRVLIKEAKGRFTGQIVDRNGICPTLCARDYKDPKVIQRAPELIRAADLNHYTRKQLNRVYSPEGICPTLMTVTGGDHEIKIFSEGRYRKLTPREYLRLMGFTDTDVDALYDAGFSNTRLYMFAGNSIVVPVLEHLFRELFEIKE